MLSLRTKLATFVLPNANTPFYNTKATAKRFATEHTRVTATQSPVRASEMIHAREDLSISFAALRLPSHYLKRPAQIFLAKLKVIC